MAPAPRAPRRPPKIPVHILAKRSARSELLDDEFPAVPYEAWPVFRERHPFGVGEHVVLIGKTKSGKTTLTVGGILPQYPYVAVLGTKENDPALYPKLRAQGFVTTTNPMLDAKKTPRVVFKSKVRGLGKDVLAQQSTEFGSVLSVIYAQLRWAVYADELPYLASPKLLGLGPQISTFFLQGSSEGLTMIVSTQEPVNVPREAFGQIEHIFCFTTTDEDRIDRVAEIAGRNKRLFRSLLPRLDAHEVVYVKFSDDVLVRTKYSP